MQSTQSVVISAAGLGSRMGLGIPKALIPIMGQTLINRALDILENYFEDIYIVGGFQAQSLWEEISKRSRTPVLILNHNYLDTGTAASVTKALKFIHSERVLLIDGDIMFTKETIEDILNCSENTIGVGPIMTDDPVYVEIDPISGKAFTLSQTTKYSHEWSGITLIYQTEELNFGNNHLFTGIQKLLPINAISANWVEIDEPHDLISARRWLNELK